MGTPTSLTAEVNGCLGILTLAGGVKGERWLTLPVLREIQGVLKTWGDCSDIQAVLLTGAAYQDEADGFGASFDPQQLRQLMRSGRDAWTAHYAEAYAVCELLHGYSKPLIALIGGDAAGASLGLASGARLRVVGDSSQLSSPQVCAGHLPDLGCAAMLANCAGSTGEWLALTGERVGAADAIALGMADVYVPGHEWKELLGALRCGEQSSAEHVVATVMERVALAPESPHFERRRVVDACFAAGGLQGVLASLRHEGSDWALRTAATLDGACKHAEALTPALELVRSMRQLAPLSALSSERNAVLAYCR